MARRESTPTSSDVEIVELQVYLNSRGRSVVNGTLLVSGHMRTVKHDLSLVSFRNVGEAILKALNEQLQV